MKKSGLHIYFAIFLSIILSACGGGGNAPPVANAGASQTVNEMTTVNLDGRDSADVGGKIAAYQWTQVSGDAVALVNANTATPAFTAPTVSNTEGSKQLVFKLKVTDDGGASGEATVKIIVSAVNGGLDAYAGENQKVVEAAAVKLSGVGSDEDGGIVTYKWVQVSGTTVTLTGANTATPSFTAPTVASNESSNLLEFRLTVTDATGTTATDSVTVAVTIANKPPVANAGADLEVSEDVTVRLSGSATDANNDALSYSWIQTAGKYAVLLNGANTATPSFTSPDVTATATLTFVVTVNDGRGATATDTVVVTVKDTPNVAPVANAGTDQTVNEKTLVTLNGNASDDADGSIASYAWKQTSGTNVTLTDADKSRPTFTAPPVLSGSQTLLFKLTVTDDLGKTADDTVSVTVNAVNDAPVANAGADQAVYEGATVRLAGSGTDEEGDALTYSWAAPAGVTLVNPTSTSPSFAVAEVSADTNLTFTLTVRDSKGGAGSDSVVVTAKNLTIADAKLQSCLGTPLPSGVELYNRTEFSCDSVPRSLDLSAANLAELNKLANLHILKLGDANISDISRLLELGGLTELYLGKNKITNISGLSALPNLTKLDLSNNLIPDISVLPTLRNLQWLNVSSNLIDSTDLASISSLSSLRSLFLKANTFATINSLAGLTGLTELDLSSTTLDDADLTNLVAMANLQALYLSGNKITDVSKLPNPVGLLRLDLSANKISSLTGLPTLISLTRLDIYGNCIAAFGVTPSASILYGEQASEGGGQLVSCSP